jgi:anhydro-N-acetylmuramic acid kinase
MLKQNYNVIGVMSGTSLDGVDLAEIFFKKINNIWYYEIGFCETIPYEEIWENQLRNAIHLPEDKLAQLNIEYTQLLGNLIKEFISKNQIKNLDVVCSHGHTVKHEPQNNYTLQIGNLPIIREIIGYPVICDFRVQDVLLGGQGAPLVPIGDKLLFSNFDFCLNLGGFSNISYNVENQRIAYDISPVNTVLNHYANQLGFPYDDNGKIAKSGRICKELLEKLNHLDFYKKTYPKSLGLEFVKSEIFPLLDAYTLHTKDILATFTAHIAAQIGQVLSEKKGKLLITGGGAYNGYLIQKIQEKLPNIAVIIPDEKTINFKEALIFGFLGILKIRNEINVLSSVTGAKHDHSSGVVYL